MLMIASSFLKSWMEKKTSKSEESECILAIMNALKVKYREKCEFVHLKTNLPIYKPSLPCPQIQMSF